MPSFKTKFSLGDKVVFFQRTSDTKKFMSAIPGTINKISFDAEGVRYESHNWHGIKEYQLADYRTAPKRLAHELFNDAVV